MTSATKNVEAAFTGWEQPADDGTKTAPPSPFHPDLPTWQVAWDSTSLGWFKTCPRYYQYQMLDGWGPRNKSVHLDFGLFYASALERYAHAAASGQPHDEAVRTMLKWTLEATGIRSPSTDTFQPWETGDAAKNRYTLIRTLVWNVDARQSAPFRTMILSNGKPAVELSFRFEAFEVEGTPIQLCGHLDEVMEEEGRGEPAPIWIKDDKTTGGALSDLYWRQWTPSNQMTLYTIAGNIIFGDRVQGVLVRAAQVGVTFSRHEFRQIPRPKAVLEEWLADAKLHITQAKRYAEANHFPMNDTACQKFGGCPFQKVCSVSPAHRAAWLREDFVKREWNPLEARGDI